MKGNVDQPKSLTVSLHRETDDVVLVEVSDTGSGMTDPTRIFEPFFSTKDDGMGMGLAICRSILEAHGGTIWARPNNPRGTVVSFRLTAAEVMPR
jgi:signal transduction histidine kinase